MVHSQGAAMQADSTSDENREHLLEEVYHGRMKPKDAEVEAARLQINLKTFPDPAQFDPMSLPTWTLVMAVAWISWRTPAAVRECWNDYRGKFADWSQHDWKIPSETGEPELIKGWALAPRNRMTLEGLAIRHVITDQLYANPQNPTTAWFSGLSQDSEMLEKSPSIEAALEQLWQRLAGEALTATALKGSSGGRPVQIPSHEWPYLDRTIDDQLCLKETPLEVEYRDVTFRSADLCRIWPTDQVSAAVGISPSPSPPAQAKQKRNRRSQQQEIVKPFLTERFRDGIPSVAEMTDGILVKVISADMEAKLPKGAVPKRDSILRAAGRR
ncbi:hypothetical protein DBIPINDM_001599 [Mesorhizobium sp. AR02]|uniref:hypothetical protein n=1 Tax=Mesorhizobium sp. AR02 TaxID=2865837 RepID=UPI00215FD6BE|nr:hypothetical protein [Mesorhizobium sp. AR02]UVK55108.1 hypothetical protein DBIPINDM_001599 [Mesorhizobium sp. AR02]